MICEAGLTAGVGLVGAISGLFAAVRTAFAVTQLLAVAHNNGSASFVVALQFTLKPCTRSRLLGVVECDCGIS